MSFWPSNHNRVSSTTSDN